MTDKIRPASIVDLSHGNDIAARTQRFSVRRIVGGSDTQATFSSAAEMFVLLPFAGATLHAAGDQVDLPGHSVNILAPGTYALHLNEGTQAFQIMLIDANQTPPEEAINEAAYAVADGRVKPVEPCQSTMGADEPVRSFVIDEVPFPEGNPRLKFFQNNVMSINWVEYWGARDRTALSPHAHDDFEQASLAIAGDYIHHCRIEWGRNANLWHPDAHQEAGPASMLIVPPEVIHTTEGVGEGLHILIDIFAPPRADFITRGWVHNASEYGAFATHEVADK